MPRLPAEFEAQRSVWLTWPCNAKTWPRHRAAVERDHAVLVAACSRIQPVDLICPAEHLAVCRHRLREADARIGSITVHEWPANDAWTRDHGPVFVRGEQGLEVVDLPFNAWGGKFSPCDDDDRIAHRASGLRNIPCHRFPMFGEGGGLESNGQGTLLVTESVWLNANRNPGADRAQLEAAFHTYLGVDDVFWLKAGMASDDTDGHIDTLARFVKADTVVACVPERDDPDADQLRENRERLAERFTVIDLPHPRLPDQPASYANFLLCNQAVLVPTYDVPEDEKALTLFTELFPDREVTAIPSRVFLEEGGAVHCLTMNEWA